MFDFADYYANVALNLPNNATIAEVGVADGASAIFLAETLLNQGKTFRLHLIDSLAYGGADQLNDLLRNVQAAGLADWLHVMPFDSLNASCRFPDDHFDFVFIDASHRYELTKADVRLWYRKVKCGGVLAGHDYNEGEGSEVKRAVDEVIPKKVTHFMGNGNIPRNETVLQIEPTQRELGVWWLRKQDYVSLS